MLKCKRIFFKFILNNLLSSHFLKSHACSVALSFLKTISCSVRDISCKQNVKVEVKLIYFLIGFGLGLDFSCLDIGLA